MKRNELLDRMIRIYGFKSEITIKFAEYCESDIMTDKDLELIVKCHEENPVQFRDEDD